jgi:phosphoribosyl 1,2-cyclic phosphodiesterase
MLANSSYPPFLKSRIAGPLGHLSNEHSAELLSSLDRSKLKRLVAAHLSKKNNSPELVRLEIDKIVDKQVEAVIAGQDQGFDWLDC